MAPDRQALTLPTVMIVGAFPPSGVQIFGGVITSCRLLLESSLPSRAQLVLIDSTQMSNPPPGIVVRASRAVLRGLRFVKALETVRPDAVVLFSSLAASTLEKGILAWYTRLRGVPALLFPRGGSLIDAARRCWFTRVWLRSACGGAAMILCQGPAWQRFAADVLGFPKERSPVISNWTATPRLLEIGHARCAISSKRPIELLFVGWVEESKGVFELIEAFRIVSRSLDVRLNIVGGGSSVAGVHDVVRLHGLGSTVRFSGWLSRNDIETAYRQADVLVLPSWGEGLPNAMIEAMAAKVAVVVTSVGNVPDFVSDGREALLVPPGNVDRLVEALTRVVGDACLRESLAEAGHALAEREFGVETAVTRLLEAITVLRPRPLGGDNDSPRMKSS